jgi:uncharacterized protein (TIGR00369 family)
VSATLAQAQAVLAAQPFSVLLGAELTDYSERGVEIRLPVTERITQQYGFVHGGVLSYLADNALTFAGGTRLQGRGQIVTSEYKINYLRPARGEQLVARATAISAGRTQAVTRCEIYAVEGGVRRLCAAAQGTIAVLSPLSKTPQS